jgi:molybdopterin synthase catalytic subunit
MRVTLLAFGILRDHLRTTGRLDLPAGSTVGDLLSHLAPENSVPWASIAVAVNQEYVTAGHALADGDEVALLPPVSGGSGKRSALKPTTSDPRWIPARQIYLTEAPIDSAALLHSLKRGEDGAVVLFDGIVRNNTRGRRTLYLLYEAYPEMAVAQMKLLAGQAFADFPIRDIAMVHRTGRLEIGDTSVAIVVVSGHRAAAFEACRWLIDSIKQTVPIWKKEFFEDGAVWAQGDPYPPELTPGGNPKKSAKKKSAKKSATKKSGSGKAGGRR